MVAGIGCAGPILGPPVGYFLGFTGLKHLHIDIIHPLEILFGSDIPALAADIVFLGAAEGRSHMLVDIGENTVEIEFVVRVRQILHNVVEFIFTMHQMELMGI